MYLHEYIILNISKNLTCGKMLYTDLSNRYESVYHIYNC